MLKQRTLSSSITATGVGLHTGKKINLRINPGRPDEGIVFVRNDVSDKPITASLKNVHDTRLSTTISNGDTSVSTVEHLLSALAGLGIDNAIIELNGPEVPIMDGSSRPFVFLIQSAGITEQKIIQKNSSKLLKTLKLNKTINGLKSSHLMVSKLHSQSILIILHFLKKHRHQLSTFQQFHTSVKLVVPELLDSPKI